MSKFEAVLLYSPDLTSQIIAKENEDINNIIVNFKGNIVNIEDWGLRYLSYNIKNYKKAFYKYYQLEINGDKINEIKKTLNLNEKIIRHLIIKVVNHQSLPTKMKNEEKKTI